MKAQLLKTLTIAVGITSSALFVACEKEEMRPGKNGMMATVTLENVSKPKPFNQSGLFKGKENIIKPHEKVSIKFSAGKGQRLMFVTMYGKSNDWFFASAQPGIRLYNDKGEA